MMRLDDDPSTVLKSDREKSELKLIVLVAPKANWEVAPKLMT